MNSLHIDEFYHDCGKALIQLFNAFPRLITVYVDDLIPRSATECGTDEYGIPTRRHQACFDTLLWLADEGYIRYQSRIQQSALDQVVLTEKSFLRLTSLIVEDNNNVKMKRPINQAYLLHQAIKSGHTEVINKAVIEFLQQDANSNTCINQ